ncbi:MAG: protein kinase [Acidobacteriota bacterium]
MTPEKLGRYEIVEELGKGAMGLVYLARDPLIRRQLALKTFRLGYSAGDAELEQFKARFLREAQSAGILSHPNIVTIHDVVVDDGGDFFIAMEYVKGTDLKRLMQRQGRLDLRFVFDIVAQIADGLDYAHQKGVVHRDIKPANIIITAEKQAKITDFGIARIDASNLTVEGQLLGTPNYMAPEQIQGKAVDHRADLFSLGVMLYEMVTGRKPFAGENLTAVTHRIVHDSPEPPGELVAGLPPGLGALLDRALAKSPADRYQRGGEMAADLRAIYDPKAERPASPRTASFLGDRPQDAGSSALGGTLGGATMVPSGTLAPGASSAPGATVAGGATITPGTTPSALSGTFGPQAVPTDLSARGAMPPSSIVGSGSESSPSVFPTADGTFAGGPTPPRALVAPAPSIGAASSPKGGSRWIALGATAAAILLVAILALVFLRGASTDADTDGAAVGDSGSSPTDDLVASGRAAMAQGEPLRAIELFDRALVIAAGDPEIRALREEARRMLEAGDLSPEERALRDAEQALDERRYDDAVTSAREALRLAPESDEAPQLIERAIEARDRQELARQAVRDRFTRSGGAEAPTQDRRPPPPRVERPAARATLAIEFRSRVSDGLVSVFVGSRSVFKENFRFSGGGGVLQHSGEVEAGEHRLRVYLRRAGGRTTTKELEGTFAAGGAKTLEIDVDAGGGLAVALR